MNRTKLVPIVVTLVLVVLAIVFRGPLFAWFGAGGKANGSSASSHSAMPPEAKEAMQSALDAYESLREMLADDRMDVLSVHALALGKALDDATKAGATGDALTKGAHAARHLAEAKNIDDARNLFGDVSLAIVAILSTHSELARGLHVFECPMTEGFGKWVQRTTELENPYMGHAMLACGSASEWEVPLDAIAHYTCPMHPSIKQDGPGTCPICGMDLTPVLESELRTGVLFVDAQKRRQLGVHTETIARHPVTSELEAVGRVVQDTAGLVDVTLRYAGFVRQVFVNTPAQRVKRGDPLFTLYSPEVYQAEREYLSAVRSQAAARQTSAPDRADYLVNAAAERLGLLGLSKAQIARVAERQLAEETITVFSPADGFALEANVVEGAAVESGQRLYRIGRLDRVWVEADVYERDLPLVEVGMKARVVWPHAAREPFEGEVAFIYPTFDKDTRTGRIRIVLENPRHVLKPDMFANVLLDVDVGERLVVPESALLYVGRRRLVFLDLGEGRMRPQEVKVGAKGARGFEVLEGLAEGDAVVTQANFLIAAESRLKSAAEQWQ